MLTTVDRYLLREIALTFLASVVVLLAMVLSYRLARYLSQAASGLLAQDTIWQLLALQAVRYMTLLVPFATLLAIMLTLGRLYRDSEMTALRACGFGPRQLYRPLLVFAVPLALGLAWLSLDLVPRAMTLHNELSERAREEAEVSLITPGSFRKLGGDTHVLYVESISEDGQRLERVFVRSLNRDGLSVTTARSGRQEIDPETNARFVILEDGFRYEHLHGERAYNSIRFERLTARLDTVGQEERPQRQETLPTRELLGSDEPLLQAELQARLSGPISLLLLTLMAPMLAHTRPREGRYGRVFAALLIYTIYVNLLSVGQAWLANEALWTALGLWWVHALAGLLALGLALYHYPPNWLRRERSA